MADAFSQANGSLTDVSGVVMYVGPLEKDFCAGGGMREVAIVDSGHNPTFLRLFGEFAYHYDDQLFLAEQNSGILLASNMEVFHASKSLNSTDATTIKFEPWPTCSQFDILQCVRAHVCVDMSIREHIKRLVLYRRDIYEGHIDPTEEPPSKKMKFDVGSSCTPASSVKYLFGYMTEGMKRATKMDELD